VSQGTYCSCRNDLKTTRAQKVCCRNTSLLQLLGSRPVLLCYQMWHKFSQIRWSRQYLSYSNNILSRLKVGDIECWLLYHKTGLRSLNASKGDVHSIGVEQRHAVSTSSCHLVKASGMTE
jgi:hypothetical protein